MLDMRAPLILILFLGCSVSGWTGFEDVGSGEEAETIGTNGDEPLLETPATNGFLYESSAPTTEDNANEIPTTDETTTLEGDEVVGEEASPTQVDFIDPGFLVGLQVI